MRSAILVIVILEFSVAQKLTPVIGDKLICIKAGC